ncbi:DUF6638 family protein [Aestuariibius sp. 2305UL40-4]|uniref:DUF6638 family protein n=1 Tax=Aestuariibius violaceus TaxID=3234132 RepID=UPI00345EE4C2
MRRLIERGLMFGNLVEVSSPVWVDRYNRALDHLTGQQTALTEFHIDISGYSPEIADELGDDLYLNHAGVNRQFILLTTEQKAAPLLNMKFSTSRGILRQFIEENEAQLFALTARDAVAGELVNSVYSVPTAARLFDIRKIRVEADTTGGAVRQAAELREKIIHFKTEEDAWFDDVLIAEMISIAKETGDVSRNPITLNEGEFEQGNFWTDHFGGLYVFRDMEKPAVITAGDTEDLGELPVKRVLDLSERTGIAQFLQENSLTEPIIEARGIDAARILRQKLDFIIVDVAGAMGDSIGRGTRGEMRALARRYHDILPETFHGLAALLRWAEGGGPWPTITSEHPAYFYGLRAAPHTDADLVNMLLAELCPLDIRQLFICHKEAFYAAYRDWSDPKKDYVARFLERDYMEDKAATREALFGHNAPDRRDTARDRDTERLIERVGPWGAVRRN